MGALVGVALANLMFGESAFEVATVARAGPDMFVSEAVATFGTVRFHVPRVVPVAVGAYITAAIFFTSSAAFANPAVTVGRMFTGTWTGIAPAGVGYYVGGQALGTLLAIGLVGYRFRPTTRHSAEVVIPQDGGSTGGVP